MRIIKTFAAAAVMAALVACNKNEGNEGTDLSSIAGTYSGYSLANAAYFQNMLAVDQTVTVTDEGNGTVSVSYTSDTFGEFTFTGCTAEKTGSAYSVTGTGVTVMGMGGNTSEYEASLAATLTGTAEGSQFVFSVPSVMGGTEITFIQGDVPPARAVANTYDGTLALSVAGSDAGTESLSCTITYVDDTTVDVALDAFTAMGSMEFALTAEGVNVGETSDGYSLEGDINTTAAGTNVTGTVSGTVAKDGSASLTFEFKPGAMPMSITGVFTSPAAANE